jgi:radical SAM protein with 4Fe4S-binding SPASM domain
MSTDEVKALLDRLAEQGVLFLLLTGGEIFARCDFREIYLHAKRLGFLLTLFTNATLIDDDLADFLAEWTPRRVEVTIYGHTEETYERVTGVKGSFRRFREGVARLRERGITLGLKTVVLRSNAHEFDAIRTWAKARSPTFRFDTMINPRLDGGRQPLEERLSPEEVAGFDGIGPRERAHYARLKELAKKRPPDRRAFRCGAGIGTFHVDPRGQIHPCMLWRAAPYDLKAGTFAGWRKHLDRLRALEVPADSGCRSCQHRLACNNCAATSQLEAGEAGRPVAYFCRINESRDKLLRFNVKPASTTASEWDIVPAASGATP